MDLNQALIAVNQIAAFLNIDGVKRRAPGAPRVAIGFAPGFKPVLRAPSRTELDRALGKGAAREVHARAGFDVDTGEGVYEIAGHEVNVEITGEVFAELPKAPAAASAPLAIGASVGHYRSTAGSLGFFAQRLSDGTRGFVSNNHVIANCDRGKSGDDILHPGPIDHGDRTRDVVGGLVSGYPRLQQNVTIVDAAFACLRNDIDYDVSSIGSSMQLQPALVSLYQQRDVVKFGRSTGLTRGRISAFILQNLDVEYPSLDTRITFNRQIEIKPDGEEPFSKPGDSGSLVVNPEGHPIGLLFAGTRDGKYSYANPIADVLRSLDIRMLP